MQPESAEVVGHASRRDGSARLAREQRDLGAKRRVGETVGQEAKYDQRGQEHVDARIVQAESRRALALDHHRAGERGEGGLAGGTVMAEAFHVEESSIGLKADAAERRVPEGITTAHDWRARFRRSRVRCMTTTALDALHGRRSIRQFTPREVSRAEIATLLDAAVVAPNHRLTQPWRFYVLGPEARRAYGLALGNRKAKKIEDAATAEKMRNNVADEHMALPLMIVVAFVEDTNPEIREEDRSATMMAVQNIAIAAVALGLGTHIKTGAVMEDPAARAAAGIHEGERIVAVVNVGEPASIPPARERKAASTLTTWLP